MSVFVPLQVACPSCGKPVQFRSVLSVNADRRPDLRDEILAGNFQRETCAACGTAFRMAPDFTYVDTARGQMFVVRPLSALGDWAESELAANAIFERGYGADAAPLAREIGATLRLRLVFGWQALEEKLRIDECGLDDVQVELLKAALVRLSGNHAVQDDRELRLMERTGSDLAFGWVASADGALLEDFQVPEEALRDIATQPQWEPLRAELVANRFVDLNRLFMVAP